MTITLDSMVTYATSADLRVARALTGGGYISVVELARGVLQVHSVGVSALVGAPSVVEFSQPVKLPRSGAITSLTLETTETIPALAWVADTGASVTITRDQVEALARAVCKDESRPVLAQALVDSDNLVATDSYRLVVLPHGQEVAAPFFLPGCVLRAIVASKQASVTVTPCTLETITDGGVRYDHVGVHVVGTDLDILAVQYSQATYPEYRNLYPPQGPTVRLDGELATWVKALKAVPKGSRDVTTSIHFEAGRVSGLVGTTEAIIGTCSTEASEGVRFNRDYLLDGLLSSVEPVITLGEKVESQPATIALPNNGKYLVMPIKY